MYFNNLKQMNCLPFFLFVFGFFMLAWLSGKVSCGGDNAAKCFSGAFAVSPPPPPDNYCCPTKDGGDKEPLK